MRMLIATALVAAAASAAAAPQPYDEAADAKAQIGAALADAQRAQQPLLLVFGANWCADCKILDSAFKDGSAAPVVARSFKVVKIDVGRFDRNVDVAERYGVPLNKGIPAIVVLSAQGQPVYATRAGELADARNMGHAGIAAFFTKLAQATK